MSEITARLIAISEAQSASQFFAEFIGETHRVIGETHWPEPQAPQRIGFLIFARIYETARSASDVLVGFYVRQSEILLRSALEGLLHLRALATHPELHDAWVVISTLHAINRLTRAKTELDRTHLNDGTSIDSAILKMRREVIPYLTAYFSLQDKLNEKKKALGKKQKNYGHPDKLENIDVKDDAAIMGIKLDEIRAPEMAILGERPLNGHWALLCESVHFNLPQLTGDHLELTPEGKIRMRRSGDASDVTKLAHEWFDVLIHSVAALSDLHGGVLKDYTDAWHNRWKVEIAPLLQRAEEAERPRPEAQT